MKVTDQADAGPTLARRITVGLAAYADPVRAVNEATYLKSSLRHLGVRVPLVRSVVKAELRTETSAGAGGTARRWCRVALLDAVGALWAEPVHEYRLAAVELLVGQRHLLEPADLEQIEALLRECRTWAFVDPLAGKVAGHLLAGRPDADAVLDRWVGDPDFWIRRSALLSRMESLRSGDVDDFRRFGRLADRLLHEREFFIRKAIGWVLRDVGRRHPAMVAEWARPRWSLMSGVTRREVSKVVDTDGW